MKTSLGGREVRWKRLLKLASPMAAKLPKVKIFKKLLRFINLPRCLANARQDIGMEPALLKIFSRFLLKNLPLYTP